MWDDWSWCWQQCQIESLPTLPDRTRVVCDVNFLIKTSSKSLKYCVDLHDGKSAKAEPPNKSIGAACGY